MERCLKRGFKAFICLICALMLVFSSLPVTATEIEELEGKTSDLQNQLAGLNQKLLAISDEISAAEMQLAITNGEILRTEESLAVAEENQAQQYENMKTRIKYMYEMNSVSLLDMLFAAESMADFLNKAEFIQNISEYDREMLNELQAIQDTIESQKATLQAQQTSLIDIQNNLEAQRNELSVEAEATSTDLNVFQAQLAQIRAEEAARAAAEEAARQAEAEAIANANRNNSQNNVAGSEISGGDNSGTTNRPPVTVTGSELDVFAAILECEAIGDYTAMLAVATVIMNRVADPRFPGSVSEVVYQGGQFEPVWSGRLDATINRGPSSLAYQVAQDALNGARLAAVINCYYFLYAGSTSRPGVNIGGNLFFPSW